MEVGDWVKVKLYGGDIIGFVMQIDYSTFHIVQTYPKISKPTKNFNVNSLKRSFGLHLANYEIIKDSPTINATQIHDLIDIALDTYDKEWFINLTNVLKGVNNGIGKAV